MPTVQDVAFAFDYSSKKLQAFYEEVDADAATKDMDTRTKLHTLCETRSDKLMEHQCAILERKVRVMNSDCKEISSSDNYIQNVLYQHSKMVITYTVLVTFFTRYVFHHL